MKSRKRVHKQKQKNVAREHITELLMEGRRVALLHPEWAKRYVTIALNIRNRTRTRLTREEKKQFCKSCNAYLLPGKNCTIRVKNAMLLYHCKDCGATRKFGLSHESARNTP